jgi:hypothetical protein
MDSRNRDISRLTSVREGRARVTEQHKCLVHAALSGDLDTDNDQQSRVSHGSTSVIFLIRQILGGARRGRLVHVQMTFDEVGGPWDANRSRTAVSNAVGTPAFSARFRCQACLLLGQGHDLQPLAQSSLQRICQYTWKNRG